MPLHPPNSLGQSPWIRLTEILEWNLAVSESSHRLDRVFFGHQQQRTALDRQLHEIVDVPNKQLVCNEIHCLLSEALCLKDQASIRSTQLQSVSRDRYTEPYYTQGKSAGHPRWLH